MTTNTASTTAAEAGAIRTRREALEISRIALAARAGCSMTALQNIEGGVIPRKSRILPAILSALAELEAKHQQ